jgi:1-deoxy-D-xylulose-5-phosphate reductoisomerase
MAGEIGFLDMAAVVEDTLEAVSGEVPLARPATSLEEVLAMDHLARIRAAEQARKRIEGR